MAQERCHQPDKFRTVVKYETQAAIESSKKQTAHGKLALLTPRIPRKTKVKKQPI
jgi:hypothetical protein